MDPRPLSDDELVYCRIPPTEPWFEPPDRISTANFKLDHRRADLGISVYRAAVVTAEQVRAKPEAILGSLITQATVAEIRALKNGKGDPLQLVVVAVDDEFDPGHAEIRGSEPGKLSPAASKALRDVFKLVSI